MLVDLAVDESGADGHFGRVRDWMRSTGWSQPDPTAYDPFHEKYPADSFGERSTGHFPGRGVYTFVVGRDIYTGGGDSYGPRCLGCGTEYNFEEAVDLVVAWSDSYVEPVLSCTSCSRTDLMGNWEIAGSLAVASFAIILDVDYHFDRNPLIAADPDPLIAALRDGLRSELGGRWVHMCENI